MIVICNQLIPKLIQMISHARGECLIQFAKWCGICLRALRQLFEMWLKHTRLSCCISHSGQEQWFTYQKSHWWWIQTLVSGMAWLQEAMGIWVMQQLTSCELMGLALCPNGLMTQFSSGSQASTWRGTMPFGENGLDTPRSMVGISKKGATYDIKEVTSPMAPGKSLMKTLPSSYGNYVIHLIAGARTGLTLTPCKTSTNCPTSWGSLGSDQRMSCSPPPLPTSASSGIWQ